MRIGLRMLKIAAVGLLLAGCGPGTRPPEDTGQQPEDVSSPADEPTGAHIHGDHSHGDDATSPAPNLAAAWAALLDARDAIAADLEAGQVSGVHEDAERLAQLAAALLGRTEGLEASGQRRLRSAVRQLGKAAGNLHAAADAGDRTGIQRALGQVDVLLQLIRAQLPQEAMRGVETGSAPADPGSAHGHDHAHGPTAHAGHGAHERSGSLAQVDEPSRRTLRVVATEFGFEPRVLSVRAGEPTRIELRNEGAIEHALVVKSEDGTRDRLHLHAASGATDAATFRFDAPGTYALSCTIPGHPEAGMLGKLVVSE